MESSFCYLLLSVPSSFFALLPFPLPPAPSSGTGEPPLAKATAWLEAKDPQSGRPARRETNTMPQWAGSCWWGEGATRALRLPWLDIHQTPSMLVG